MMKFRGTEKQVRALFMTGCELVFGYPDGLILFHAIEDLKKAGVLLSLFLIRSLILFA